MSELKARRIGQLMSETGRCDTEVYLKSEADKVIAELEYRIADGDEDFEIVYHQNKRLLKIVRHQKYKRCLVMARWCEERYNYLTCLENWQMTGREFQQVIGNYWDRWYKRWLELAEQFKEAENGNPKRAD